jgi:hypothetical protein
MSLSEVETVASRAASSNLIRGECCVEPSDFSLEPGDGPLAVTLLPLTHRTGGDCFRSFVALLKAVARVLRPELLIFEASRFMNVDVFS